MSSSSEKPRDGADIKYREIALKKRGASAPWRDLSRYRRCGPGLEAEEERLVIILAQSGHDAAGWRLHQAFHGKILSLASRHVPKGSSYFKKRPGYKKATLHTSELFEDLVAAGHLALWEAIKGFNIYSEYRLWTFAAKSVPGAIRDACYAFRRLVSGVSRIDRWLFGHWNVKPEELFDAVKRFGLKRKPFESVVDAAVYIEVFRRRYGKQSFDTSDRDKPENMAGKVLDGRKVRAAEDIQPVYDAYRKFPLLHVHKRISGIIDDLASGRAVKPERHEGVAKYFDKLDREKWTKSKPKTKPPLPLLRPRRWRGQSKRRRRKNYVLQARSAEGRS
jgi:hypothetical protein